MEKILDLYTDYLLLGFGQASATGLSKLLDNKVSHDKITQFLSKNDFSSKDLWVAVKPLVKEHKSLEGCLSFDDTIIEKMYTDENELICWHWDHSKQRAVKGINLLTALYYSQKEKESMPLRVPVAYEAIHKPIMYSDLKTRKVKRKSTVTKNELMRQMIDQSIANGLPFKYILADSWFSSVENMKYIVKKKKFFIFDMQANRHAALSIEDKEDGHWRRIDELEIANNSPLKVWLKDLSFPLLLTKQVFTNKDNSSGVRFLISNDLSLSDEQFTELYKKRWSIEEFHKSIKQNASVAKSPTRTIKTQSNHLFASLIAYIKLEQLRFVNKMNHFALKASIYYKALKAAFKELKLLKKELSYVT